LNETSNSCLLLLLLQCGQSSIKASHSQLLLLLLGDDCSTTTSRNDLLLLLLHCDCSRDSSSNSSLLLLLGNCNLLHECLFGLLLLLFMYEKIAL
jgi:hypothetical protein